MIRGLAFQDKIPKYKQIAEHIEKMILRGDMLGGTALPPERELALQLGVNRSTIVSAYDELRSTGLVYSIQGSGTRVSEHLWDITPNNLINWSKQKRITFKPYQPIVSKLFQLNQKSDVIDFSTRDLSKDILSKEPFSSILKKLSTRAWLTETDMEVERETSNAVSTYLRDYYGMNVDPELTLITTGIPQGIILLIYSFLETGNAVAIECPSMTYRVSYFTSAGIKMVRMPMDDQGLIPEEIPELFKKHRIKMLFTNPTYQNPTGTTLSLERRKKLIEICREYKIPIVEIDLAGVLNHSHQNKPPATLYELDENKDIVIYVGGLPSSVSINLSIGWIVAPKSVYRYLEDAIFQTGLLPATVTRQITSLLLQDRKLIDPLISHLREVFRSRRQKLLTSLEFYNVEEIVPQYAEGGTNMWLKHTIPIRDNDFVEICLKHKVPFLPGSLFGADHGYMWLSLSWCNEAMIEEGVKSIKMAIEESKELVTTSYKK